ncbi:MAG TPA: hypothetical protein VGM90_14015 [Kofleriaceae bacterium]|jgi:hypothetical protein
MTFVPRSLLLLLIVIGSACGKKDGAASSAGSASAPAASGSGSAMADASTAVLSADAAAGSATGSAASGSAAPAGETRDGILLAKTAGGKITLTRDDGKTEDLADGTDVKVTGYGNFETAVVNTGDKHGRVATDRIVINDEIQRSPKGDFAVVRTEIECVDLCAGQVWLVHGTVTRWRVFEMSTFPNATWHPQGTSVAVGGDGVLAVIGLPSGEVEYQSDAYMAPAYAPDGTLYVRDENFGIFTFIDGKAKKVGKGKKPKQLDDELAPRPQPVTFGADGKLRID